MEQYVESAKPDADVTPYYPIQVPPEFNSSGSPTPPILTPPTNDNYDNYEQYYSHYYSHHYPYQYQLPTLGLSEEHDQANTVTLKSESENPTPLNWDWELAAQWNSESGIGWNEWQPKQESLAYHDSPISTPESTSTISESVECTYNFNGYVFGSQDVSDDLSTLSPHDFHQLIEKEFERGWYLVQNEFGQFEWSLMAEYAQVAAGSEETRAQYEQLMLHNIAQQQEGSYVLECQEY